MEHSKKEKQCINSAWEALCHWAKEAEKAHKGCTAHKDLVHALKIEKENRFSLYNAKASIIRESLRYFNHQVLVRNLVGSSPYLITGGLAGLRALDYGTGYLDTSDEAKEFEDSVKLLETAVEVHGNAVDRAYNALEREMGSPNGTHP